MKGPHSNKTPAPQEMYATSEMVTPESLLLDVVERLGRIRQGWIAAQIHLSQLKPHNRQDSHLRIAVRMFDPLVSGYRCQVFLLTEGDVVIIGRDVPMVDLDAAVFRLRALFDKDPLTFADPNDGPDPFVTYYYLDEDFEYFFEETERLRDVVNVRKRQNGGAKVGTQLQTMDPEILEDVITAVRDVDILPYVRRQAALTVVSGTEARVTFQEFFISMQELRQDVAPDVNLFANRWLFQHLTQLIDRRALLAMRSMPLTEQPKVISLNINLSTIESNEFKAFEKSLKPDQSLIMEVQLIDIFADLDFFFKTRDALHKKGYKIILDGMTPSTLHFTDISKLGVDSIKLTWSPELLDPHHSSKGREPKEIIKDVGSQKFILCRCDTEASIGWGLEVGILSYQGHLIDTMLAFSTMRKCADAKNCTKVQCSSRGAAIGNTGRSGCTQFANLDHFPPINPALLAGRGK